LLLTQTVESVLRDVGNGAAEGHSAGHGAQAVSADCLSKAAEERGQQRHGGAPAMDSGAASRLIVSLAVSGGTRVEQARARMPSVTPVQVRGSRSGPRDVE